MQPQNSRFQDQPNPFASNSTKKTNNDTKQTIIKTNTNKNTKQSNNTDYNNINSQLDATITNVIDNYIHLRVPQFIYL